MQLGLASLTRRLVSAGDVTAIRVLDKNYFMLAFESTPSSQVGMEIDYAAMPFLQQAIQAGETVSFAQDDLLVVVAPVTDLEEQPLGAVMVYLSMDYVQATLNRQVRLTVVVAGVALGLGVLASPVLARRVTGPVAALTNAASAVEAGDFDVEALMDVAERQDELDRLARVFTRMARQVQAREQSLRQQVEALRIEVDDVKTRRQGAEVTETEYFQQLQQQVRDLRSSGQNPKHSEELE